MWISLFASCVAGVNIGLAITSYQRFRRFRREMALLQQDYIAGITQTANRLCPLCAISSGEIKTDSVTVENALGMSVTGEPTEEQDGFHLVGGQHVPCLVKELREVAREGFAMVMNEKTRESESWRSRSVKHWAGWRRSRNATKG